jgi:hypothetical protein
MPVAERFDKRNASKFSEALRIFGDSARDGSLVARVSFLLLR